jgi:hypothetical protein
VPIEQVIMRRATRAFGYRRGHGLAVAIAIAAATPAALAAPPAPAPTATPTATATATPTATATATATPTPTPTPPVPAGSGLAVVALPGATDAAWPLAQAVYATPSLRPAALDDPRARVLCGDAAPAGAPPELRDLAETVGALRGDDAPSRALLADITHRLALRAVVVVRVDAGRPTARVFLAETSAFDAATYTPDDTPASLAWSAATRSLARAFGPSPSGAPPPPGSAPAASAPADRPAPALATHEAPRVEDSHHRQFYESGWFWGALGAAAFAGGAVFLATRDSGPSTIHLQIEVPH